VQLKEDRGDSARQLGGDKNSLWTSTSTATSQVNLWWMQCKILQEGLTVIMEAVFIRTVLFLYTKSSIYLYWK